MFQNYIVSCLFIISAWIFNINITIIFVKQNAQSTALSPAAPLSALFHHPTSYIAQNMQNYPQSQSLDTWYAKRNFASPWNLFEMQYHVPLFQPIDSESGC